MSGPANRLRNLAAHLLPSSSAKPVNFHTLSPTIFLPRAADIEPNAVAIYHVTSNNRVLQRTYIEMADRARGLAYYVQKHGYKRVGILAPNTPAFLEAVYGIAAAGAINAAVNYRLKEQDIAYIFDHAEVDLIIVDHDLVGLLDLYRKDHPDVPLIIDTDTDATEGQLSGPFDGAVLEGLEHDASSGNHGWVGLRVHPENENEIIALAYTSGTTSKPKGVELIYRGAYLGAMANIIESNLNTNLGRCKYLWTLPMFHGMGWTFPWAVTVVRGTHYCLRKIDYSLIWKLLLEEGITHYSAAPTVNTLLCAAHEAQRLSAPVHVTVAASPPTPQLFEKMVNLNLHPVHVYGMTETYGPITRGYYLSEWDSLERHEKYARMARQGHGFVTSLPVRVTKRDAPPNTVIDVAKDGKEVGEVVFSGNICSNGYHKNPEANAELFAGGVLHSGDLAVWHPDSSIQVMDRAKDVIISGGENISSVALESMLGDHPDILETGVVAVKDSHWGERPKAYVTVVEGRQVKGDDVIDWARRKSGISRFMIPREVEVLKELPKTGTGKIKKNVLRDWARGGRNDIS